MEKFLHNTSQINIELSEPHNTEERLRHEKDTEHTYYELKDLPELQFVIAQLAATVIPVQTVYKHRDLKFYSKDATLHGNYKILTREQLRTSSKTKRGETVPAVEDLYFIGCIFNDTDHTGTANSAGSVLYDFNCGDLRDDNLDLTQNLDYFIQKYPDKTQALKTKILTFKKYIEGEEGLRFITAIIEKSGYSASPENIQHVLETRSALALAKL